MFSDFLHMFAHVLYISHDDLVLSPLSPHGSRTFWTWENISTRTKLFLFQDFQVSVQGPLIGHAGNFTFYVFVIVCLLRSTQTHNFVRFVL